MEHPFRQLQPTEINAAAKILKGSGKLAEGAFFCAVSALDPPKANVLAWAPGAAVPRIVRLTGTDNVGDGGFEADIELGTKSITLSRIPSSGQVCYGAGDMMTVMNLIFSDSGWQAAMAKRGLVGDLSERIQLDPWPAGGFTHPAVPTGHRSMRVIALCKADPKDNGYSKPVHGLIAHVDLTSKKVVFIEDHGVRAIPSGQEGDRYDASHLPPPRQDLKPIEITQPSGPSFSVTDGNKIMWLGWEFRVSIHPLHTLELRQVSIKGRPLLYKANLADMVVPYGDTDPMHAWKHVLDATEYGMGNMVESLELGCDCLGDIHYLDHHMISATGEPITAKNAICIHEEDANIAWRHHDSRGGGTQVRRNRRLVVSSWFTVGNYDYGVSYHFYPDGNLQVDVSLSGIVGVSSGVEDNNSRPGHALYVAPQIVSPLHQHLFSVRIDWNLDGGPNTLLEQEVVTVPKGPDNPGGTQFRLATRTLETESAAKRLFEPFNNRVWKVINSARTNPSTHAPPAYKVLNAAGHGGGRNTYLGTAESAVAGRAAFATYNLWATPFTEGENSAAGDNSVMSEAGHGLPHYTRDDRNLVDVDLVTWHTIGVTHVPRSEDWPVMPTEHAGLMLVPAGFFERNPVMDLPEGNGSHAKLCAKL